MRVQIDVSERDVPLVEYLKKKTGSRSWAGLYREAMNVLAWAVDQKMKGREIYAYDPENKTYYGLSSPTLESISYSFLKPEEVQKQED